MKTQVTKKTFKWIRFHVSVSYQIYKKIYRIHLYKEKLDYFFAMKWLWSSWTEGKVNYWHHDVGNIWVFHVRPIWHISVRLSERSKVTQNKINFIKNCPQWSVNSQPPDHQSHALLTEVGRNLSELSFLLFHAPLHILDLLFLESIEQHII